MRLLALILLLLQDSKTGTITGRITPEVPIKLILKKEQSDAKNAENVKGEVLLPKGGEFRIENIPPGRYDLLFEIQGDEAKKWHVGYWSDLAVQAGKAIEGINYRLTPADSRHMIDEILVTFKDGISDAEIRKIVEDQRCRIKRRPPKPGKASFYMIDIPDDTTVEQMVDVFKALPSVTLASKNGLSRSQSD